MFLRNLDMLSPTITLYYKQNNTHPSFISGILTIFTYLIIFIYGFFYFLKYINRSNPMAYFFNRYVEDVGTFSFSDSNFFNYIQIVNGRHRKSIEFDSSKIEIIGINKTVEDFLATETTIPHWIYGKCDNEINMKEIDFVLKNEAYNNSACLKQFYNPTNGNYYNISDDNFEWPNIQHGASHPNYSYYGVIIRRCENSSINKCSSEKEINSYLNEAYISFNIIDHYVDILNYSNPVTKFIYSITNPLFKDSYIINNLNFNPGKIKSYDNVFSDKTVEQTAYFFHENSRTTALAKNSNIIAVYFILMQNTQLYYERRYQKLQDALSDIGGYGSIITLMAKCLNYLIARFKILTDTQEILSKILNKNISVYEKLAKTKSLKKFIEEKNDKNNEEENKIKIYDSGQNIKKLINKAKSEDGKDGDKKILSRRINVINGNLGEETNRINKNSENSEQNIISEQKPEIPRQTKGRNSKNFIKQNFALIDRQGNFNCCNYFCYLLSCKHINSKIKYYEELRRLIISEECMTQNYLNIYKLLELHDFN